MNRIRRTIASSATVALGLAAVQLLGPTSASATATTRWVSPTGTGTTCSQSDPCELLSAISTSATGDTVIMKPGSYPSASTAYEAPIIDEAAITLEGQPGKKPPVISSTSDAYGIDFTLTSTIRHIQLHYDGDGIGLENFNGATDRVTVISTNTVGNASTPACEVLGATGSAGILTNSLCVERGANATAVAISGNGNTFEGVLRNVTAVALGMGGHGILANELGAGAVILNASNTIALAPNGTDVESDTVAGGEASVHLNHSDFKTTVKNGGTIPAGPANLHSRPKLDKTNNSFRELLGSPTVNAGGTAGVTSTSLDLDGNPRFLGSAPDIGAYERLEVPRAGTPAVPGLTHKHSIKTFAKVNPQGLATTVKFVAFLHGHKAATATIHAGAGRQPHVVRATIKGLAPGKTYKLQTVATNRAGTARSGKSRASTS